MAHSLEVRVPFLDKDFLELVLNIDPSEKLHDFKSGRIEKYILRDAFRGNLRHYLIFLLILIKESSQTTFFGGRRNNLETEWDMDGSTR
jgi:asparagine synthetase B (glutamine-hydrolysing)